MLVSQPRICLVFRDLHKLDNVTSCQLTPRGLQAFLVRVQDVHVLKVRVPHAHHQDGERQLGGGHQRVDGLLHVVDDAVREDQEDVVLPLRGCGPRQRCGLANDLLKKGRAAHDHTGHCSIVGLEHARNAGSRVVVRRAVVEVGREAVVRGLPGGQLGPEPINGEELVRVIKLHHLPYTHDSLGVRVQLLPQRVDVVQRVRGTGVPVRGCEIYGSNEADFCTSIYIVQEGRLGNKFKRLNQKLATVCISGGVGLGRLLHGQEGGRAGLRRALHHLLQVVQGRLGLPDEVVVAVPVPVQHLEAQRPEGVPVGQLLHARAHHVPQRAGGVVLDLRAEDGRPRAVLVQSVDTHERVGLAQRPVLVRQPLAAQLHLHQRVHVGHLLGRDHDRGRARGRALSPPGGRVALVPAALQRRLPAALPVHAHHPRHWDLHPALEIAVLWVYQRGVVAFKPLIRIVNSKLDSLNLFKTVHKVYFFDKVWILGISNNLCAPKLCPIFFAASSHVHDTEGVTQAPLVQLD
mmetsp:Transcript_42991/g.74173  ORF Transcript_42991/g.74173 Transcript_42991/m.74173 type:complete len:518 (-) Transcript_42991:247-1800(-)